MLERLLSILVILSIRCVLFAQSAVVFSGIVTDTNRKNRTVIATSSVDYPDLDLYYSQMEKNCREAYFARMIHLMGARSHDDFIRNYMERGDDVLRDTVSLFSFFQVSPAISKEERLQLLEEVDAAVIKYKNKRLKVVADYFRAWMMEGVRTDVFNLRMEAFEQAIRSSRKVGYSYIELLSLRDMLHLNANTFRYARSFVYAQRLEDMLEAADGPCSEKGAAYVKLGKLYYDFKDYDRALPLLYKGLLYKKEDVVAWNYLAVYHQMNNRLDSAAYYNRAIIASEKSLFERPSHTAIAISNLGRVEQSWGNYDAALAMLQAGLEKMRNGPELNFIAGLYISLGEVWLAKGNLTATKNYIDSAYSERSKLDTAPWQYRAADLFTLESRYYAYLGQHELSKNYMDSAWNASRKYQELTGQHFVLLGEQQLQEAEMELKSQQVMRQKQLILFVLVILTVILGCMLLFIGLYRKKNAAYKLLARKAGEWAHEANTPEPFSDHEGNDNHDDDDHRVNSEAHAEANENDEDVNGKNRTATREDLRIMSLIAREMTEKCMYRDAGLSAESLAEQLGIHRNVLSKAINRVSGTNYSQYINGFRVKEAIRIISQNEHEELYIGELYERVGFSTRSSFYRAFKQFTGLSPAEFQKNTTSATKIKT